MRIYIVPLYNRVAHEYVGQPVHTLLVYADSAEEAERKASFYKYYMVCLDPDSHANFFEVDHLDEERILSCGDDIKAYIVSEYYKNKCGIFERSQILYGRSSAEIRRSLPPCEGEGEITISALPKILDIIL